jgi:two-component system, NtrC family, sensor kinase
MKLFVMVKKMSPSWLNPGSGNGKPSITRKTLLNMSLRVTGVVAVSAIIAFFHVMSNLETQTKQKLEKYIAERGQRESSIFQLAEDNLTFLRGQFVKELEQIEQRDIDTEFDRLYVPWNDGTLRNFSQNRSIKEFDTTRFPSAVIGRNVALTPELKRRLLTGYQLLSAYGPAWSNRFVDLYFTTPENTDTNYWSGTPRNLEVKPDFFNPTEEYFYVADPKHRPDRKPAWTGLYLDTAVNIWMVSAVVPIYQGDRFLGIVGHDIVLTNLMEQTIHDQLPGSYNLIFRADGRLIAHPHRIQELQQAQGQLKIEDTKDPRLQRIFQLVSRADSNVGVVENTQDNEYLAITRLRGPGWYFVTVYPKSLLSQTAFETTRFVLISGIIALFFEVLLLYSVLQQQIASPLRKLTAASDQLSSGNFDIHLDVKRQDELGDLARSFNSMTSQLKTAFIDLESANVELEGRVTDRTKELQSTMAELQRSHAQMVQTEKMSSLGQLVAGVAHEINNPVSFIHGNLKHVQAYSQDLLHLIQFYQQDGSALSEITQAETEDIDLAFIQEDLPKILDSMQVGTDRIRQIVLSLRNFSRLDEADMKAVDIHDGIDSTLLILQHRLNAQSNYRAITVMKDYGILPKMECYAGPLNQVFMNILLNAIDALEEQNTQRTVEEIKTQPSQITIRTSTIDAQWVEIAIADNAGGMSEQIQQRIFDPFFTTKPVGKGTGMGMAISYQIITEKHGGQLKCFSTIGQGSEFVIQIPIQQQSCEAIG